MRAALVQGAIWKVASVLAVAAAVATGGCKSAPKPATGKPIAVATIFAYYDALRTIAGQNADCVILLPPNKSPHEYEPTVQDRVTVSKASLVVRNGLLIDNWVDGLVAGNSSAVVVDVSEVLKREGMQRGVELLHTEEISVTPASEASTQKAEDVSAGNPHIWLDPRVQAMASEAIRDALVRVDPAHSEGYKQARGGISRRSAQTG